MDAAVIVPGFGVWARYDNHAHRWLTGDHINTLFAAWFEKHGTDYLCKTLNDPSVIEAFARSNHRPHLEFLETPRAVGMAQRLKSDLNRVEEILDASWERHREPRARLSA